jgi:hypothetical protein
VFLLNCFSFPILWSMFFHPLPSLSVLLQKYIDRFIASSSARSTAFSDLLKALHLYFRFDENYSQWIVQLQ